jgi:hypothetical protein|tara:strand:- start:232 stop:489 length:258 start_codon:yes stop_codon:yes gene_type:complete
MINYSELNDYSVVELQNLKRQINIVLESKSIRNVSQMGVGQLVNVNHKKAMPGEYKILKINRKTVLLKDPIGGKIKASLSLISAI